MNPYGFVRLGPAAQREAAIRHDQFKGFSGRLHCRLTALTHLFIPQTQETAKGKHQELRLLCSADGRPLLPGSSLKGVIRNVAEAISGSCLTLPLPGRGGEIEYRGRSPVSYRVLRGFEHCRDADHLCPACRIFGSLSGGNPFLGKIGLGDAVAMGDFEVETITIEALMEPKPRHRAWYEDPVQRGYLRGRKFYYHRPLGPRRTAVKNEYNKTIEAIKPGAVFEFDLDYTNLTEAELALLVFALTLEPGMAYKVGMGKPVGLGSARIEIVGWEQIDRQARYRQFGGGVAVLEGDALSAESARWQGKYHQAYANWQPSLADLRRIWVWDPSSTVEVRYPGQDWFRKNPRAPIEEAP
ncbi:MAG: RAMP superfamily CRISPR-associated protein [Anaerolineae bacterium]|jgi:CRISPR/Cas system CSM-associated protein Csm3 (group 7 of RAMP superfamily)|nr:RAMP superfamily CRISPR-associated protein [Anaerolineae bacterium]MDH7475138.1 RAMP superfamily CRISPR-associated protein [Anaerolineae bacterium]